MKTTKISSLIVLLLCVIIQASICNNTAAPNPRYENASTDVKVEDLRHFFAQVLQPKPQDLASKEIPIKAACRDNTHALWLIANEPQVLTETQLPQDVQDILISETRVLAGSSESEIKQKLALGGQGFYDKLQRALDKKLESFNFGSVDALKQLTNIDVPKMGESWTRFLKAILTGYFASLEFEDKKRVLAYMYATTSPNSSKMDVLLSMVYGAGPFFHKYMQLLSDYLETGTDADLVALKNGLANVKSGLPHIDPYFLDEYIRDVEKDGKIRLTVGKSLGAASVGETFLAQMSQVDANGNKGQSQQIVVKFMRPGIEEVAERETRFFDREARKISLMMELSFKGLKEQILEEMDYHEELKKLKRGYQVYDKPGTPMRVVRPIDQFPQTKYYMGMELAEGRTFKEVRVTSPLHDEKAKMKAKVEMMIKGALLDFLTIKYIENAFFLSPNGFFHGDLHEGNMLMSIDDEVYTILQGEGKSSQSLGKQSVIDLLDQTNMSGDNLIKLTLIDFGNAHSLTHQERSGMLNLFVAAAQVSRSTDAFLQAFNELSDVKITGAELPRFKAALEKKAFDQHAGFKGAHVRIGEAMDTLMDNDIPIPPSIIAFSRSLAMLDNAYKQLIIDVNAAQLPGFGSFNINSTIEDMIIPYLISGLLFPTIKQEDQYPLPGLPPIPVISGSVDVSLSAANVKSILFSLGPYLKDRTLDLFYRLKNSLSPW